MGLLNRINKLMNKQYDRLELHLFHYNWSTKKSIRNYMEVIYEQMGLLQSLINSIKNDCNKLKEQKSEFLDLALLDDFINILDQIN